MLTRSILATAALALLAGCASGPQPPPEVQMACKQYASQVAAGSDPGNYILIGMEYGSCLRSKGY